MIELRFSGILLTAALSAATGLSAARSPATTMTAEEAGARPNHLVGQTSPYLLQHLYNPVDWYPWGEAAFGRARLEGKPIFLSIGYSACHWCHVMEREAFSDPDIARVLAENFVSIKVDREERPDLDEVYMTAVLAMTGSGGWPMSVFLTPDLEPFFGGTYFPRDQFRKVLLSLADAWRNHRQDIVATAERIRGAIADLQRTPEAAANDASRDDLGPALAALEKSFDRTNGGFGGAPKFPPHGAIALLLQAHAERGDARALDMAVRTLDAMARGGLYDQIGGGFHRYSTDEKWRVPHFEKMLYDNALLVPLYLEAWKRTGRGDLRLVAQETIAWAEREMIDPAGAFYATLDADSEGEEGRFYLWTADEVRRVVGTPDADLVLKYYGVTRRGELPGGRSILHVAVPAEELARQMRLAPAALRQRIEAARRRLFEARAGRLRPRLDDKILTGWNGLMISALAKAYRVTGDQRDRDAAVKAAHFVLSASKRGDGRLAVSWRKGEAGAPGCLDDSAFLAQGLLDLYDATAEMIWLDEAERIVRDAGRFQDSARGGYFFTEAGRPDLIVRTKSLNDGALPSGNAIMATCLARLAHLRRDEDFLEPARRTLSLAAPGIASSPAAYAYMILAAGLVREAAAAPRGQAGGLLAATLHAVPAGEGAAALDAPASPSARPFDAGPHRIKGTVLGRANPQRVVESQLSAPERAIRPGEAVALSVDIDIQSGWHVNSNRPTLPYLIPTRLEFPEPGGLAIEDVAYPDGRMVELKFAKERLSVYEGRTTIHPTIRPPAEAAQGPHEMRVRLTYQACSNTACLAPETVEFAFALVVEGQPVAAGQALSSKGRPPGEGTDSAGQGSGTSRPVAADNPIARLMAEGRLLSVLLFVFFGGLALNLTPCVYPMIPVTIGFFGNQAAGGGWGRRVALPSLYVLGMAITYSVLGVIAGLSGVMFGAALQSPWVVGGLVLLFVAMALWMFGLYELRLPSALTRFSGGRTGGLGAFFMGLTMGLVAAPCIGPFVVTLIAFVGASGNPVLGFWLFFVMSLGLGLPFLVLGAFSGALASLPRSGVWLIYAKKVMGVALLGVAVYFLQPFLSDRTLGFVVMILGLASGAYLAVQSRSPKAALGFAPVRLLIALAVVACGAWLGMPLVRPRAEADWRGYSPAALDQAKEEGRPVMVDFFAEWCAPCRELDRNTFSDPRVRDEIQRFVLLKADLTSFNSDSVRRLRERYDVVGVPTIVLIDGRGEESKDLRLHGFEEPELFLARLRQVR